MAGKMAQGSNDYKVGDRKPPKERQFGQPNGNPRNPGGWRKQDTARYKLEQMLKLDEDELKLVFNDPKSSLFERKLAGCIRNGDWKVLEGMMNQVYGQPKQKVETVDTTPHGIELTILQPKAKEEKKSGEAKQ